MDRAPVDGGHVEYLLHGSGDPMLFIHGAGIADAFVPLMNRPPLAGLQQIHYRRRGYGQSPTSRFPGELNRRSRMRPRSSSPSCLASEHGSSMRAEQHSSGSLCSS